MNEIMIMIGLVWSTPVALEGAAAVPQAPAPAPAPVAVAVPVPVPMPVAVQAPAAKADLAVARVVQPVAPKPAAVPRRHAILFFTASWCPACLRMKSETLP